MGESVTGGEVRTYIARELLESGELSGRLGSIVLRAHQVSAAGRLRSAITEFGGALLCDQVGMGKTFVALALSDASAPVTVVAPAVLREMWLRAGESAARSIQLISTESLSRTVQRAEAVQTAELDGRLLIVDEAHHFRNPSTRRYDALASLAAKRTVLLLTATPIHNKRRDLAAMLALFLGSHSDELSASELGRLVVRRERNSTEYGLPQVATPEFREIACDDSVPQLLLGLPPPLPPRDGGDGGALLAHSLIRQWASSDAALNRALVRRLQRAASLIAALESGTYPSLPELSAWVAGDDCIQLGFAELLAPRSEVAGNMLATVQSHADSLSVLLKEMRRQSGRDLERANVVRSIRRTHPGLGIVAFSQYADTIDALFRLLSPDGQVAALTGRGARVSGGRISRSDAIARFAPAASGARAPHASEEVTLLLSTDLLSEGVNLQDAAVVIHLDLPWTPARMEQRLGRVARMGSRHERVFSYVLRPPASAETLVRIERTLRDKMSASGIVVDRFQSLAEFPEEREGTEANSPRTTEEIRAILERWSRARDIGFNEQAQLNATFSANVDGFLALCSVDARRFLVASDQNEISTNPSRILELLRLCEGSEAPGELGRVADARDLVIRHFDGLFATESQGTHAAMTPVRRSALHRIARITSLSRPHERARVASIADRARSSLLSRIGAHGERRLITLASENISDEVWMQSVAELGQSPAKRSPRVEVLAVLLFSKQPT